MNHVDVMARVPQRVGQPIDIDCVATKTVRRIKSRQMQKIKLPAQCATLLAGHLRSKLQKAQPVRIPDGIKVLSFGCPAFFAHSKSLSWLLLPCP